MIDIENKVINTINEYVIAKYPQAYITTEYSFATSQFPCVQVIESDNSVYERGSTLNEIETMAYLTYEINIFSNKQTRAKEECKDISTIVDEAMVSMGFRRVSLNPIQNYADNSIYRYVGRWSKIETRQ